MKPCSEDGCLLTISSDRTHHERARTFGKGHDVSVPQNALGTTNANLGNREVGVAQRDIVERTGSQRNSGASNAIRPLRQNANLLDQGVQFRGEILVGRWRRGVLCPLWRQEGIRQKLGGDAEAATVKDPGN